MHVAVPQSILCVSATFSDFLRSVFSQMDKRRMECVQRELRWWIENEVRLLRRGKRKRNHEGKFKQRYRWIIKFLLVKFTSTLISVKFEKLPIYMYIYIYLLWQHKTETLNCTARTSTVTVCEISFGYRYVTRHLFYESLTHELLIISYYFVLYLKCQIAKCQICGKKREAFFSLSRFTFFH